MSDLLSDAMGAAVFLQIEMLKERGGPTDEDMKKAQETSDMLGERGDILLCGGGKKGERAELFNRTAHSIACLAFVPGGVTIFGATFEAKRNGGTDAEDKRKS
ncbi:MAG: hypothetical protein A2283_24305 [Lentisphaerae bacterium RIFOXYA12_FULL_48_11]|nr:MAG: hypothetical protein A2283_24305 [Lentisphaerae bacterium RIFOXYA12_FULL_48_11]